jgi:hypothetical protein
MARLCLALFATFAMAACAIAVGAERAPTSRASVRRVVVKSASPAPGELSTAPATAAHRTARKRRAAAQRVIRVGPSVAFAKVRGVPLFHPSDRVERVGFHQASDVASVNMTPMKSAVRGKRLPSRYRPTSRHTAVDIVVDPRSKLRAPVSGVVKKTGRYRLYCKHPDAFVVISPDGHPDLEVKILHITGVRVRPGDRVEAGKTPLAWRATKFSFGSQIDAFTAKPAWPHVHMEVTKLAVPSAVPVPGVSKLAFGC